MSCALVRARAGSRRASAGLRSAVPGRAESPPGARAGSGYSSCPWDPGKRVVCIADAFILISKISFTESLI